MSDDTLAAGAAPAENPAPSEPSAGGNQPPAQPAVTPAAPAVEAGKQPPAAEPAAPKGPWGDDWREKLAGSDEKRLERLKRFADPVALLQSQEEAQRKISEGLKPRERPGEKATEDEWAEYRKEHGIPDKVDDYVKAIALPDKRQIGEADKPVIEAFSERAIKSGIAPADMTVLVDEYYRMQEETQFQQAEEDSKFKKEAEKTLKADWGGDYSANIAAMRPYFDGVDGELFDNLMGGRMADGRKVGDHPAIVKFFATKAVAENPLAAVLPSGSGSAASIDDEIAKLEKRMGEDRNAWFKDDKAQARLQQLYTARERIAAK
jgi:hypothetical protein